MDIPYDSVVIFPNSAFTLNNTAISLVFKKKYLD